VAYRLPIAYTRKSFMKGFKLRFTTYLIGLGVMWVVREVLYETRDKLKQTTYILEIENNVLRLQKVDDYGRFISKKEVVLKDGYFINYYERYYKDGSSFSNGIICDVETKRLEQILGTSITDLFMMAVEKIRKGNGEAFDGLWFLCNVLNVYQQPYWVERVRQHILS